VRASERAGTSLVEVLVAMSLVLLLVVGAAELAVSSLRAKRRGDVLAALTRAVGDRFESLKSRPFDDGALAAGSYAATVRVEPGHCLVDEEWEIDDDGEGLKRVQLSVVLNGRPGPETTAVLFISRDLGFAP
jgi:hypothetical protein